MLPLHTFLSPSALQVPFCTPGKDWLCALFVHHIKPNKKKLKDALVLQLFSVTFCKHVLYLVSLRQAFWQLAPRDRVTSHHAYMIFLALMTCKKPSQPTKQWLDIVRWWYAKLIYPSCINNNNSCLSHMFTVNLSLWYNTSTQRHLKISSW